MALNNDNVNKSIDTYLNSSYEYYKTYDRFVFLGNLVAQRLGNGTEILDIGCAKGEFIYYLKEIYPNIKYTGIEISEELVALAKKEPNLAGVDFIVADARSFELDRDFDVTIMSGVLSIFDDFTEPLSQMVKHTKQGGCGYIFGRFNEKDIDVLVRYKNHFAGSKEWESGLNCFCHRTIMEFLSDHVEYMHWHKFNLQVDLSEKVNPVSSFTLNTREKGKIVVNGANMIADFYCLEFRR